MVTAPNKLRWFNAQQFAKSKPADVYRIFSVGGSTTFGRPYEDSTSFSGWLRELLAEADSNHQFEVTNAGGISYASYRVLRVMEELAQYEPDLFIVYTGHNEFLEERTYRHVARLPGIVRAAGGLLGHTRIYALLHHVLHRSAIEQPIARPAKNDDPDENDSPDNDSPDGLPDEVRTRLDGGVGPDAYQRDDPLAEQILEHFRFNLERMVQVARAVGAEIVFVTPASNLADCSPFKSEHLAGMRDNARWQRLLDDAQQAYDQGRFDAGRQAVEDALTLSPRHAQTHYLHGRILQKLELHDLARQAFLRARDEDVCPLRALSRSIAIVRDMAAQERVPVIDFERLIEDRSPNRIPDSALFLDHVHPTMEGNRLLAVALFDYLAAQHAVSRPQDWDAAVARVVAHVESQIDPVAQGEALRNLAKVLAWAGKLEEANQLALQADKLVGGDAETAYLAGNALLQEGKTKEAAEKFQEALRIDPDHQQALNSLGSACFRQGDLEAAQRYFERVIDLNPEFAPAHNNLAALHQQRNEVELAIQHYQEAIRLNPRYSKAYNNLGVLRRRQSRLEEAANYFHKALAINPDFAEAHFNLGTIFDQQGDPQKAISEYQQALRLDPRYAPASFQLGVHLEQQQQWRAAARAYRDALQAPRPRLEAVQRLAWILATCPDDSVRSGRIALAMAKQSADATGHQNASALSTLAAAYAESGDLSSALKWQTEAVRVASAADKTLQQSRLETLRSQKVLRAAP